MAIKTVDWLPELKENYIDPAWLEEHIEDVYDTIHRLVRHEDTIARAIDVMLLVYPLLMGREDLRRWSKLLQDTLRIYRGFQPKDKPQSVFIVGTTANNNRQSYGRRRPREKVTGKQTLEIYLTLFMATIYQDVSLLTEERILRLLDIARTVNSIPHYYKVYQTLIFVYNQKRDFERAAEYARRAYTYLSQQDLTELDNRQELALTCYGIASRHYDLQDWDVAEQWYIRAGELFLGVDRPLQYGVMNSMVGLIHFYRKEYEAANQWLKQALDEFVILRAKFYVAKTQLDLGMVQGYLNQLEQAHANVSASLAYWLGIDNVYQQVHCGQILAWLEALMNNEGAALFRIEENLKLAEQIGEINQRERRYNKLLSLQNAVQNHLNLFNIPE